MSMNDNDIRMNFLTLILLNIRNFISIVELNNLFYKKIKIHGNRQRKRKHDNVYELSSKLTFKAL